MTLPVLYRPPQQQQVRESEPTVAGVVAIVLTNGLQHLEPRSQYQSAYVLRLFAADLGTLPIALARPYHLKLWIDSKTTWRSDWTKHRSAGIITAAFRWAWKLELIDRNPFGGVSYRQGERGQPIEARQFQAMLRVARPDFRRFLIALRYTGARPGELTAATWKDVDVPRGCITLVKHKTSKKTGRPRRIILHPVVVKLLGWIKRHYPHPQLVFVTQRERPWGKSTICRQIKAIRAVADVPADTTSYGCRHAFATQAIVDGVNLAVVAELCGHVRIETTMRYTHLTGKVDHLRKALASMSFKP